MLTQRLVLPKRLLRFRVVWCDSDNNSLLFTSELHDSNALEGVAVEKGYFDVNLIVGATAHEEAQGALALYLDVIRQTYKGFEDQNVTADIIVAFHGMAVTLITDSTSNDIKQLIAELDSLGVKFEAFHIPTSLFGVDNSTILQKIKLVDKTFISAIGHQPNGQAHTHTQ